MIFFGVIFQFQFKEHYNTFDITLIYDHIIEKSSFFFFFKRREYLANIRNEN